MTKLERLERKERIEKIREEKYNIYAFKKLKKSTVWDRSIYWSTVSFLKNLNKERAVSIAKNKYSRCPKCMRKNISEIPNDYFKCNKCGYIFKNTECDELNFNYYKKIAARYLVIFGISHFKPFSKHFAIKAICLRLCKKYSVSSKFELIK